MKLPFGQPASAYLSRPAMTANRGEATGTRGSLCVSCGGMGGKSYKERMRLAEEIWKRNFEPPDDDGDLAV